MPHPRVTHCLVAPFPKYHSVVAVCLTKCLNEKHIVFQNSSFLWNSIIRVPLEKGLPQKAIDYYRTMQIYGIKPNHQTVASILKACKSLLELELLEQTHSTIIKSGFESDLFLSTSLMAVYLACSRFREARKLFDEIPNKDMACWNAMIVGYVNSGNLDSAIDLFCQIPAKNQVLINTMIVGLAKFGYLNVARHLLDEMPERDLVSANAMITGFAKSGDLDNAYQVFSQLPKRDLISWNSMIAGYAQMGQSNKSLMLFRLMLDSDFLPDGFTFSAVLSACARIGALYQGKWIHNLMIELEVEINFILSSALIDMYSKCGRIKTALEIFDRFTRNHVSVWNSTITGLAIHGLGLNAIEIFSQMRNEGIEPDSITFVGILTACSHSGLIEQGKMFFKSMKSDHSIEPEIEHYGAMVDLLGRAGQLEQAFNLIKTMPIEPDTVIWRALLSACRIHGNPNWGELAIGRIECRESGDFVLLSNIYSAAKKWNSAERIRNSMKKERIRKNPGLSWIEINGIVHEFFAGDQSHPQSESIYRVLDGLIRRIKPAGFVPATELVLVDVSDEEKESALICHSEKLAVAFGIMSTSPRTEIRIVKNLRICHDCHSLMKLVSRICCREIIVRDRIRFHRFERGSCSCKDYW